MQCRWICPVSSRNHHHIPTSWEHELAQVTSICTRNYFSVTNFLMLPCTTTADNTMYPMIVMSGSLTLDYPRDWCKNAVWLQNYCASVFRQPVLVLQDSFCTVDKPRDLHRLPIQTNLTQSTHPASSETWASFPTLCKSEPAGLV